MIEENVSLPVAQALASALAKIEAYVPTEYVDNSEPDLDAEHLNHAEQGIMRVTNLLNAAVDVIQGQESRLADAENKIGTAALTGGMTDLSSGLNKLNSDLNVKSVVDQFTAPANTKVTYAYKYGNVVVLNIAISGIKDGWNYINLTTKYSVVCPAVASIHKSTGVDKDIFVSCTFNGTSVTVLANANFNGDLTANFVLIVR